MPPSTNPCHPPPGDPMMTGNNRNSNRRMKANITITTLNVNGFSAPMSNMSGIDKWVTINWTINDNKIAILALQETHIDHELLHNVRSCFGKRLEIVHSQDPTNPRVTAGVAFVINKSLIKPREYKMYVLQEGRAAALKIKWLENEETTLINVYAPNN
jgi:exonuclease III